MAFLLDIEKGLGESSAPLGTKHCTVSDLPERVLLPKGAVCRFLAARFLAASLGEKIAR